MNWNEVLFGGWPPLARTVVVGVFGYVALVGLLRTSGKRTLSKFNAFDFVVTVAFGSTLATMLLSQQASLAQGALAFFVLLGMQFVMTWLSVRSERFQGLIKAQPTLLLHRGQILTDAMRRERVTREELLAAARSNGIASVGDVEAAVLETDGTITIVQSKPEGGISALQHVRGYPRNDERQAGNA